MRFILSLAIPLLVGYSYFFYIFKQNKISFFFSLAVSFGLGMGFLTLWMIILSIFHLPLEAPLICIPLLLLLAFYFLVASRWRKDDKEAKGCLKENRFDSSHNPLKAWFSSGDEQKTVIVLLCAYVLVQVIFVFLRAAELPIDGYDAIFLYAAQAKVFFYERNLDSLKYLNFSYFPLELPLFMTWMSLFIGNWDETFLKLLFSVIFIAYLGVQYGYVSFYLNRRWALVSLALLVSSNFLVFHATQVYRDMLMMYYVITALIMLIMSLERKDDRFLVLAGLLMGFGSFTKLEGTVYMLLLSTVYVCLFFSRSVLPLKTKLKKVGKLVIPGASIYLIFVLFNLLSHISVGGGRFALIFSPEIIGERLKIF